MTRRRIHLLIALLLPLLMLRAVLPAGYMPVAENGEFRMVLCSAGLALPGSTDAGDASQPTSDSNNCPFALAAAPAPPPAHSWQSIAAATSVLSESSSPQPIAVAAILRAQSSRAPPALSI